MNTSSIWPSRTSTTAAPRREARKPTASASASTKPSCRSSIRWRSANASTPASSSCRLTSIPGSPGTTNSDHIRGAGATAKRQCRPSLTLSHSPGRNHWPHDVGQTQPFRHQTGQLSDQVSASTHQATHWTGRAMAKAIGISVGSVQRVWRAHKLQPHRLRTFKRSGDPSFAAKLTDIVGLYLDPPAHAVVLSIDEKSQIQALDRTQPRLPIKPGRCQTLTHDYKRHGTTTLFAALSVLDGTVIGRCMQRHRHIEFIRFLNTVERQVSAGKLIHVVLDNYATHKHPKSLAWLARHPRWTFHFTPTSASWLNAVENFFSKMTRQRIRRGVFRSIADLQAAINGYLAEHN